MAVYLQSKSEFHTLQIPVSFVDCYMPQASGEFVKVYLTLLRRTCVGNTDLTIPSLADFLNCTEKDILRALKYWERMNLLKLEYKGGSELSGITLLEIVESGEEDAPIVVCRKTVTDEGQTDPEIRPRGETVLKALETDEEFKQFLFVAGQYMGAPLKEKDCELFAYLHDQLKMSAELLEYLIEYCVGADHKSMRYIEKTALDWHEKGIVTTEQAKNRISSVKKETGAVMKAFGLNGRQPAPAERQMMDRWFDSYGFSQELVLDACNRTMAAIHKPSFEYADRILTGWLEHGVKCPDDVRILDEKHDREKNAHPAVSAEKKTAAQPTRFHNFEQRDYDFDELLRRINQ